MSNLIDLRKYNINTEDDAIEFINLIVTKAPQLSKVLKDHQLKVASLKNRLAVAERQQATPAQDVVVNTNATVLERITAPKVEPNKAAQRLEQMKAVQVEEAPVKVVSQKEEPQLPEIAPEGEIGQLQVNSEQTAVPVEAVTEEEVVKAAGSPSERSANNDVQPEDSKKVASPTKADVTPIGTSIANKTGGELADPASAAKAAKINKKAK